MSPHWSSLFLSFKMEMCSALPAPLLPSRRAVSGTSRATSQAHARQTIARGIGKDPRFVQAVLDESVEVLLDRPFLLVVTRFGHTGVNAGIDQSNVGDERILLLPENPSKSAERLRASLGKDCAVIITDTCGRPFRTGVAGVAVGWSGIAALRDWRGECDMHGKVLEITLEAIVDEIAAAANLLMGEAGDGTPAVVFRGLKYPRSGGDVFMAEE